MTPPPRVLHARWILPVVAVVASVILWRTSRVPHWRTIAPGVEFATLSGEPWCRYGSSSVALLRIDPRRVTVRARYYAQLPLAHPPTIVAWQRRTHALAVFNAGQFYPDWRYMGLLVAHGDTISSRAHPAFQAALVASSAGSPRDARVLDLARTPIDREQGWSEVAQSFMLFDREGGVRVRRGTHVANRTAVGEDDLGRLMVAVSEGGYTLTDYADMLRHAPLRLTHAMAMDGGLESELVVERGTFRYASFGPWPVGTEPSAPGAMAPLPTVITLESE